MKISLIIPTYNESKIIEHTANVLSEYMKDNFDSYEIIFSDDGSSDNTVDILRKLALPNVGDVEADKNYGKGHAIRLGVEQANGDVIMFTDADLAYGTDVILMAYDILLSGDADVVLGSRNIDGGSYGEYPILRRRASKLYIKLLGKLCGFKFSDSQCGCKAFRGNAAKKIFECNKTDGFAFDIESILLADAFGLKIVEMPVMLINHCASTVAVFKDSIKMFFDVIKIKKRIKKY